MNEKMKFSANVKVNALDWQGELPHNWNYIGTDECNYIQEPDGEAMLAEFGRFAEKPYYVRCHHLFCTGNRRGFLKWGSTNVYTEDKEGNPVYDFTTFDRIFDIILRTGCKPFVEFGFMPYDLVDQSYLSNHQEPMNYGRYQREGWACPPKDYKRWQKLVSRVLEHLKERYGKEEVITWYYELWNEPDLGYYWKGSFEDFYKLYDYTVAAVEETLPEAKIGGPAGTSPWAGGKAAELLDRFLEHCRNGVNYATGAVGTRLDYISFHVKGGGFSFSLQQVKGHPSVDSMVRQVSDGLDIIEKNGYQGLEVVLSEADPDGWAAGGMYDNINLTFRNTPYYASFVASCFHHIQELAASRGADVRPLSWAFVFPGERCFEGTRAFQTRGVDKAVFNMFRMYALIGSRKIAFTSSEAFDIPCCLNTKGEHEKPEVNGIAAMSGDNSIDVLVYCHHDDMWRDKEECQISLEVSSIPFQSEDVNIIHYRIDDNHSNAFQVWSDMGRPDYPAGIQLEQLKSRDGLEMLCPPQKMRVTGNKLTISFELPVNGVSLIRIQKAK